MIVSVSRRTDIPAFYSEWFFNRLSEGFVYVVNPMNTKQVSKIDLNTSTVDCFVFWTKNPKPMIKHLDKLKDYKYYFQYTITGYKENVEKDIGDKKEIVNTFKQLSDIIGNDRVILRYDPIFLNKEYTIDYHCRAFAKLCTELDGYTEKCIISFMDNYKKTKQNTKTLNIIPMTTSDMRKIALCFSAIAKNHGISIQTCSEEIDLKEFGVSKGKCIDDDLISKLTGYELNVKKDNTQRESCGCVKSVDIGQYNTCKHHCLYCYANYSFNKAETNYNSHDQLNALLSGNIRKDAKITTRQMASIKGARLCEEQLTLQHFKD